MLDLHRHDEFSNFDGYGKPAKLAKVAKANGLEALGISNHGTMDGLTDHYFACLEEGIKPILGCEVYFQPVFNKEKPKYHLCLFAKNLEGYQNLCKIVTEANAENFYYKPTVTFKLLEKYSEGIICTSACVGGLIPQLLVSKNEKMVDKVMKQFIKIFGDDFYLEIQPYKVNQKGLQEKVNRLLIRTGKEYKVKCILTSDSHFIKEEYSTYLKLREMAGHDLIEVEKTYSERYMPKYDELSNRFIKMHGEDYANVKKLAANMYANMNEIIKKVEGDYLSQLPLVLPKVSKNSAETLKKEIIKGLKKRGKYTKKYLSRCIKEFKIITMHNFEDYFLIVQDYVDWAKKNGIMVGPGRGSVCNCLVAYALGITDVDSIYFNLNFDRFLREDKKKLPDIDLDFPTDRRGEVIEYIINKYPGKAVQICSYGLYKIDNLLNDLIKVTGIKDPAVKTALKKIVNKYIKESNLDVDKLKKDLDYRIYNKEYDNILEHFANLYKHVRYIGTHAAGVALVGDDITNYTPVQKRGNNFSSAYDLYNIEHINVIKFDILGLKTMSETKELEVLTGDVFDYSWLEDEDVLEQFKIGNTSGIFQCESNSAKTILSTINADNMEDVIAANALNRPGPLSLGMPEMYANNKENIDDVKNSKYYKYTKETYGTIVYQEQLMSICRNIGNLDYSDIDKILNILKHEASKEVEIQERKIIIEELKKKFYKGAKNHGFSREESDDLFMKFLLYLFNKGHATGYSIISMQQMYHKVHNPLYFWYIKMKYAPTDNDLVKYKIEAVKSGIVVFFPHVNYSADFSIKKFDGDEVIVEGLCSIKNVGEAAAKAISEERKKGPFKSYDDFVERVPKRSVNIKVINALFEAGALEFNKKIYLKRVVKYNSVLFQKGM